jgi:16S rRNA (guanine527-N7)-methyltransferase
VSLTALITARAETAGLSPAPDVVTACASYLEILAKWNRRMNLTALAVDPPSEAAIDRLILEPLSAARHLLPSDRHLLDLGSGGGSPAIPMKIAAPWMRLTMVEVREKKAAFLREATRALGLAETAVETRRIEDVTPPSAVSVVSIRAVKVNDQILKLISAWPAADKRVFWFRGADERSEFPTFQTLERHPLPGGPSELLILRPSS